MRSSGVLTVLAAAAAMAIAGPNRDAELFMDLAAATPAVDSTYSYGPDDTCRIAVRLTKTVKLYSFQFYVTFDTAQLRFLGGSQEIGEQTNMLASSGGSLNFTASVSKRDSKAVLVGATILGDDASVCPSGNGLAGVLRFTRRTNDSTVIGIRDVILVDFEQADDESLTVHSALITPATAPGVGRVAHAGLRAPLRVSSRDGMVRVTDESLSLESAMLLDIQGRTLARGRAHDGTLAMQARGNGCARMPLVLAMRLRNGTAAVPLLR